MKRKDLIRRIAGRARAVNVDWVIKREGASHTVYSLGRLTIPIPRHTELGEKLVTEIFKECAAELGEGWWK
ncbi:MAG TPA: hypothetical protein VNG13_08625 [Mycobacteriales bacterium]|nr:hypothetical protein [Mycobacteriales bacterium]